MKNKINLSVFVLSLIFLASLKIFAEELAPSACLGKTNAVSISSENSGDGGTSYKLGGVGMLSDGEMTGIELHLNGAGILSFDWKVSSEADWDLLSFYEVGSGNTNRISGTGGDWARVSLTVGGGPDTLHTFRWEYEKDPISDYVGEDCGWVDAIRWNALYNLVVNHGSGDGAYADGTVVMINADPPPQYHEFDRWTGDASSVADLFSSETTIDITDTGLIVTATYKPILYSLIVNHGSGSGSYPYNSAVQIDANSYSGKIFYCWTGDVDALADVMMPATTFTTGDGTLSITATYSIPVTVNNGSGGGWHPEGSVASFTADPDPMYMEFAGWTGDAAALLDDPTSRIAHLTVPDGPATLTAIYTASIARVAGCYGRTFTQSGTTGGVSTDAAAGSPSGTPAVMLGGSGVVPDNGFAAFETEVWGSGSIMFNWKVSSESGADYLKFKVDGSEITAISGTKVPWTQISNRVDGAGVRHTLRWEYVKNAAISSSADAGWVDDIVWLGDVPIPAIRPDIRSAAVTDSVFSLIFLGERGMPYTVYSNAFLRADGWVPMDIALLEMGETNGLFRFLCGITRPLNQNSCFYHVVVATPSEYNVTFVDWDDTFLKTEQVVQGASATAPAVDPKRESDNIYWYVFAGWDIAFNNVQSDLTVTAQYAATPWPAPDGMVRIPGGTNSGTDPDFGAYSLTVEDFYMEATEVTKTQWDEVYTWAISNGYSFDNTGSGKAANHPVHTVNWHDCVKWCNARSQKEGRTPCYTVSGSAYKTGQSAPVCNFSANGYRLPTNTEWEYAGRGGLSGKRFPWGDTISHSQANYNSSSDYNYDVSPTRGYHPTYATGSYPYTSPAGTFAANGYGLYDMAGNLWEWCNDASGLVQNVRGGCWYYGADNTRCGNSGWDSPGAASLHHVGFRSVCR